MSTYTADMLAALRTAYAQGILELRFEGQTLRYESGAELRRRIADLESEVEGKRRNTKTRAEFSMFGD